MIKENGCRGITGGRFPFVIYIARIFARQAAACACVMHSAEAEPGRGKQNSRTLIAYGCRHIVL